MSALAALAARVGLGEEGAVLRKASEYERLLQARLSSSGVINETCRSVICLHLAANTLGVGVDTVSAIKYSGLKKPAYLNMFNMAEKLLQLKQILTVSSVCLQQQCVSASGLATRILEQIAKVQELDTENPQYVCMAVYQACKTSKIKVSKSKLIATSRLKPAQWAKLEADWTKLAEKIQKGEKISDKSDSLFAKCRDDDNDIIMAEMSNNEKRNKAKIEDYETWRKRILEEAHKELKILEMKEKDTHMEVVKEREVTPRKSPRKKTESPLKCGTTPKMDRTKGVRLLF